MMYDDVADEFYGQATDDGDFDDVGMFDGHGNDVRVASGVSGGGMLILAALVGLWFLGAFIFKGSNQS